MKYVIGIMVLLYTLVFAAVLYANCTGCGEDGHQMCPIEGQSLTYPQQHEKKLKEKEVEAVFAVCVFADGTLIDHKGADSMSDCLKTKRKVTKMWKTRAQETDTVEINGIEYKIDGEHLAFMCDLVDAHVHRYADGTWEIIEILGKHKED